MTKLTKIELTKVHYYDNDKLERNIEISTISRNVNTIHDKPIIKKNIFGHRWVLKINENENYHKHKCNIKVILYILVFCCIIIAIGFGVYLSFGK